MSAFIYDWKSSGGRGLLLFVLVASIMLTFIYLLSFALVASIMLIFIYLLIFALVASIMLIFIYLLAWKSSGGGGPVWWERHDLPPFQIKAVPLITILITNLLMMNIVALQITF